MPEDRFLSFFCLSLPAFIALQHLIRTDSIFQNNSYNQQADPAIQLACTLYHFGQYGNSTVRAAEQLEIGEGTTRLYVYRTIIALLRSRFRSPLSPPYISQHHVVLRTISSPLLLVLIVGPRVPTHTSRHGLPPGWPLKNRHSSPSLSSPDHWES